jgi:hypothetical protein
VKPGDRDSVIDGMGREPELAELCVRDHAVLAPRDCPHSPSFVT